jgi:hypothetical protein
VCPFFLAGPSIKFAIAKPAETAGVLTWKSIDFTIDFGGGIEFEIQPGTNLLLDARYSLGLANVVDLDTLGVAGELKTRGIHIMAGVAFAI